MKILILCVSLFTALSVGCITSEPTAPPATATSSTNTPVEDDRLAATEYLKSIHQFMDEYFQSREDFRIQVYYHDEPPGNLLIFGDVGVLRATHLGLRDRLTALNPPENVSSLVRIEQLMTEVIDDELAWLANYVDEERGEDVDALAVLRSTYMQRLNVESLVEIDRLMQATLALYNIPSSAVDYLPDNIRVTVLSPRFITPWRKNEFGEPLTELEIVQQAMNLMIGEREIAPPNLTASVAATSDFSAVDLNNAVAGVQPLYPVYLPFNPTKFSYTWDMNGRVYQDAQTPTTLSAPHSNPICDSLNAINSVQDDIQQLRFITVDLYGDENVNCSVVEGK